MKLLKIATAFAALLLVAGCTAASAEDTTPKVASPAFGPGWRHEQMVQARAQGHMMPGTIDTTQLPGGCPMKTAAPTK